MYSGLSGRNYGTLVRNSGDPVYSPYAALGFASDNPMMNQMLMMAAAAIDPHIGNGIRLGLDSQRSAYDKFNQQHAMNQSQLAISIAAQGDAAKIARSMQNFNQSVLGGLAPQAAVDAFAAGATGFLPSLANNEMGRQLLDSTGMGGSAMMGAYAYQASRFMRDPFTNRSGLSAVQAGVFGREIYNQLYETPGVNMGGMRPMAAGQLMDEMSRRGMLGTLSGIDRARGAVSMLSETNSSALNSAMSIAGISPNSNLATLNADQLTKLRAASPELDKIMQGDVRVDARAVGNKIKDFSGAISAVAELMGPNSPMSELWNALEEITNGSTSQISPQRAEMMVRQFSGVARASGLGLEGMSQLMGMSASRAANLGLNPVFAAQIATGSGAYRRYLNDTGAIQPTWGLSNADQLMVMDTNLRAQASDSQAANWAAGIMRMSDMAGMGDDPLVKALRNNDMDYLKKNFNFKTSGDVVQYMVGRSKGKIDSTSAGQILADTSTNQQYIFNNNIGQTVRNLQGVSQVDPYMTRVASTALQAGLGISEAAANASGSAIVDMYNNLSRDDAALFLNDETYRSGMIADRLMANYKNDPAVLARMKKAGVDVNDPDAVRGYFTSQAGGVWSSVTRQTEGRFGTSMANMRTLHGRPMSAGVARVLTEIQADAVMQSAVKGLGKDNLAMSVLAALQDNASVKNPDGSMNTDTVRKVIAESLGVTDPAKVTDAMVAGATQVFDSYNKLKNSDGYKAEQGRIEGLKTKLDKAKSDRAAGRISGEEYADAVNAYNTEVSSSPISAEVQALQNKMRDFSDRAGVLSGEASGANAQTVKVEFPESMKIFGTLKVDPETGTVTIEGNTDPAGTPPNPAGGT